MFINDLPEDINSNARLCADYIILYRQLRSADDQQLLQLDLEKLASRGKRGMKLHPQKCSALHMTRSRSPFASQYQLNATILTEEQTIKYLGWTYRGDITSVASQRRQISCSVSFGARRCRCTSSVMTYETRRSRLQLSVLVKKLHDQTT